MIPLTDLIDLATEHGCTVEQKPNGAVHVRGRETALRDLWRAIFKHWRNSPRFVTESRIDGVPQPGYPRIEVHPQVVRA